MVDDAQTVLAAIEAGGTKFICAVTSVDGVILARQSLPTTTPEETLNGVAEFFNCAQQEFGKIVSLGIACFGPVELNPAAEKFGYVTATPKKHWSNTDIVGFFKAIFDVPVAFQTDVNGAALGEMQEGAAQGLENFVYVTIGTGIGAGIVIGGALLHGAVHPEIGHLIVPRAAGSEDFTGGCAFHGANCLEGVAAGPSVQARWGCPGHELGQDHQAWKDQAYYLAVMCVNLCVFCAPEKIVLGGGVMAQKHLFPMIRDEFSALSAGYIRYGEAQNIDSFIVPSELDGVAGLHGAILLAQQAMWVR